MIDRHYNLAAGLLFVFTWGVGASAYAQTLTAPADQIYVQGETIELFLPEVTGGTSTYTYSLTPIPGLTFDEPNRKLSGIPTTRGTTTLTYSATDTVTNTVVDDDTFIVTVVPMATVRLVPPPSGVFINEGDFNPSKHIEVTLTLADGALKLGREVIIPVSLSSMIRGATLATPAEDYDVYVNMNDMPQTFDNPNNPDQMVMLTFAADTTIDDDTMTLSQIIDIRVKNDMVAEDPIESVRFSVGDLSGLKGVTAGGMDSRMVTINIISNDDVGIVAFDMATGGVSVLGRMSMFTTTEGDTDTFYVQLISQPTSTVTVTVTSTDTGEGIITTGDSLIFTTTNWNMRQPVTVTGVDDNIVDGNIAYQIDLTPSTDDPIYSLPVLTAFIRSMNINTNAVSTINLSVFPTIVNEEAGATDITVTATLGDGTVVLTMPTTVTVSVGSPTDTATEGTDYLVVPDFTLTIPAFTTTATGQFPIAPISDFMTIIEGQEMVTIGGTATGFTVNPATLILSDVGIVVYDTANFEGNNDISTAEINENGGTDTLYVQLASEPANDVMVMVTSTNPAEGTITSGTSLTFSSTNWGTRQPVEITAVDDNIIRDGDSFTVEFTITDGDGVHYPDPGPDPRPLPSVVVVTVIDDDSAALALFDAVTGGNPVTTLTTSEPSGTANFYVQLTSAPTADVTVAVTSDDTSEGTITTGASLMFDSTNWDDRQEVIVTVEDDNLIDGAIDYAVRLASTSTDTNYSGLANSVTVTNSDDDTAELIIADTSVNEDAGTAAVTVTLTSAVTAGTVTVDLTTMDGTAEAGTDYTALTSETVTFIAGSTSETLNIPINDDNIDENDETFAVILSNLMAPTAVTIPVSTVTVTIIDDDTAALALFDAVTGGNPVTTLTTSEPSGTANFYVQLTSAPTADVTVAVTSDDTSEGTITTGASLMFDSTNWDDRQEVIVTGVNDDVIDGDQTYDLTLEASGGDYAGVTQTVSVTNTDNDVAALTVVVSDGDTTTSENLTTDSFTVALAAQPSAEVSVTISGLRATEHTLTPASNTLTFGTGDWATAQTVTLSGVNDDVIDGDQTYDLTLEASGGDYAGVTQTVSVTNTDNDVAALTVVVSDGDTTTSENLTTDSFTVALAAQPSAEVSVTISGLRATEHTLTPASNTLTFGTGDWATAQTVTLSGVNDDVIDGDQTYDLTLEASGGDYAGVTQTVSVTNTDNDVAALTVVVSDGDTTTSENLTTDSFTVALAAQPSAEVSVTISGLRATEHTLTPASNTLTFGTGDWATAQTVTLSGVNDDVIDGDQTYDLTLEASGGDYAGVTQTVSVTNTDNDVAALTVVVSDGDTTTSENLTTDSFTVALAAQPSAEVSVTISGLRATEHTLTPASNTLTFGTGDWATAQTVTLSGVNDDVIDGDQTYDLTLEASGGDYAGVTQTVSVTNTDNDVAALTVVVSDGDTTTSENLTTDSFTVALAAQPSAEVSVTISGLRATEHTLTPASNTLTFGTGDWATAQTVTLSGVNDDVIDGDQTYDLTLEASGGDYAGVTQTVSVTNTDNDVAALTVVVSDGDTTTSENLTTDSFTVALAAQPSAEVSVTISGLRATEHTLTPASNTLTFGTGDWATAQTVTLSGVNDDVIDGDQTYDLTLEASGGDYAGVTQTVSVTNTDNDVAALTVVVSDGDTTTSENLTTDSFTVALAAQPSAEVSVTISGLRATEHTLTPASNTLTFGTGDWATAQTVTLSGVNDDVIDGDQTYDLTLEASGGDYAGVTQTVSVTNTDNDVAALTVVVSDGDTTTSENLTTDSFTVALAAQPSAEVSVTISGLRATEHTLTPASNTLTFGTGDWDTAQTVTLSGVNDDVIDGDQTYDLTLEASGGDYGGVTQTVSVTNTDNDVAALTVVVSDGDTTTSENLTTDSFTVALAAQPSAEVSVTISGLRATEHTLTPASNTLTFGTGDWATAQTVTLSGVNDDVIDGDQTYDLTLEASGGDYGGVTQTVSVTNTDNDVAALTVVVSDGDTTTSENLTTDSFTVALAAQPSAEVSVTISGLRATEHTLTPASNTLTFGTGDWATAQTVTLSGVNDDVIDGDQTYDLTLEASGGDYAGVTQTVSVTNTDNDVAALTVVVSDGDTTTSENLTTDSFTVALAAQPSAEVSVTISGLRATEHTLTPASNTLTFGTGDWATAQTVTLSGVNDDVIDGDQTYDLTLEASGGDYAGVTQTVSVTNTDNDVAALTVVVSDGDTTTSENLTTDSFTVALAAQPSAEVSVTISGLRATEHTLTPASNTLTFGTGDWATAQTVTLSGVNDDVIDGDQTYDLTLEASGGDYAGVTQTVSVTNTDNDVAALTVVVSDGDTTTSENLTTDSFTVALAAQPSAEVSVTISGLRATEHTLTPASNTLTFGTGDWATAQTVTLSGVNDDVIDGDQTYDLTLEASGGDYAGVTQTVSVTNTDNDVAALTVVVSDGDTTTSENLTTDSFTVALAAQPSAEVSVTISGLRATEHTLTPASNTLTFGTGDWATAQTVTLSGVNDDVIDGDQTYDLTLEASGGDYAGVTQTVSVTNTDNESMTTLSIADMRVNEDAGIAAVTLTLRNGVTAGNITVEATTMDGTAEAGTDYTAITNQLVTFVAGSTSETLDITINNDNIAEGDETFTVMLSNLMVPTGVTAVSISNATATVTITDDDTASTTINLSVSPLTVAETADATDITVTATIDGTVVLPTATDVMVTISDGTATGGGTDYTATPTTLTITIPAGATSGSDTFTMTPVADDESDTDETITISGTSGSFTVNSATLTIIEGLNTEQREVLHGQLLSVTNQTTMQAIVDVLSKRLQPRARTEAYGSVAGHVLGLQEGQTVDWQKRLSLAVYSTLQRLDDGGALLVPVDATTFNNSEFALPLEVGESVVVLWGALGSSTVAAGNSDASDYDGDLIAVLLGIDSMIGEHARLGIAASYEHSELDYQLDMTSGDAVQTMTSIQPYLSWQPHDSVGLWLLGGYGFGDYDATESTAGGTTLRAKDADVERWMAALGFHYVHRFGSSGWDMVLNNKALWNRTVRDATRFDDGSLLPKNISANWRARLESEVGYSWTFGDGGSVRPYGLASVRWDGGDVVNDDTTFMVDAGGGVELSFASRLSMDFKVRRQVTDGDHEEHSVVAVGSFGFAEHEDGQGWQVALERSLLGGLSAPEHNKAGFDFEQGDSTPTIGQSPSLQANVGYGRLINPLNDAEAGLLKTYTRFYLDPDENKRHAVGLGFDFASLQVGVESEYNNGEFETLLWGHIDF